jgi:hypothetical protein
LAQWIHRWLMPPKDDLNVGFVAVFFLRRRHEYQSERQAGYVAQRCTELWGPVYRLFPGVPELGGTRSVGFSRSQRPHREVLLARRGH